MGTSRVLVFSLAVILVLSFGLFLPSVMSMDENMAIANGLQVEDTPRPQDASTEELIPVIIYLNTDASISALDSSISTRISAFDAAKHEVSTLISGNAVHPMSLSSSMSSNRGGLKRDLRLINAVSADIPPSLRDELLQSKAVKGISSNRKVHILLAKSTAIINATEVWQLHDAHGDNVTGKGVVIAVLDTGVNYNHPDLGGGKGYGYKVVGGYDFVNADVDPMDDNGHGTMIAGIIAADGALKGVAPDATLLVYKVINSEGYGREDIVAEGIERALADGADIICLSLGVDPGFYNYCDTLCEEVNEAVSAGVTVVAAAGNSGPYIGSIASPANSESTIAVGALETAESIATINVLPENETLHAYTMLFSPSTNITGELVYAGLGYPEDFSDQSFIGKIALIERGHLWFEEKVRNAYNAGAIGAIIFNNRTGNFYGSLINESQIPAFSISQVDGDYLLDLMERTTVTVMINQTTGIYYDKIAVFSSLGPGPGYAIKPDLVAPGTNINSTSRTGSYDASYVGTSLAAPHVAGACALLLQLHPDWTPELIKAALMNNAHDLGYNVFEQGAGRVDVYKAATAEFIAQPPSISAITEERANAVITVQNLKNYPITLDISVTDEEALQFNLSPVNITTPVTIDITPRITLGPFERKPVDFTLTLPEELSNLHYCGRIAFKSTNASIAVPFAFRRTSMLVDDSITIQSAINLARSGDTLIVAPGNYSENLVINKPLHIRSLSGPSKTSISASNPNMPVFEVNSDNVSISGFAISGRTAGIQLQRVLNNNISDNYISENDCGIELYSANGVRLENNTVVDNTCGINLLQSDKALLENNRVFENEYGMEISQSNQVSLENNRVFENEYGIKLGQSDASHVVNNTMFNNSSNIEYNGNNGCIFRNTFSNGQIGIAMKGSYNNAFSNNTVLNNKIGMELVISDGNTIRNNNMVNNTKQVEVSGTNVWDGNYWSDYEGADNDEDGIGDTPYQITRGIEDKHPYMQRDGWLKNSTCLVTMENAASADIPKEERANTMAAKSFGVHTPATTHRLIKPILLESRQSY